eukprot:scaffold2995_cov120-Isochrysis_galbana.AAC.2
MARSQARSIAARMCKSTSVRTAALRASLAASLSSLSLILWGTGSVAGFAHGGCVVHVAPPRKEPTSNHPAI